MARFCRPGDEKRQEFGAFEYRRPDSSGKFRFGPRLAQTRGVTAILALPEWTPPAETPPGSSEGETPAEASFEAMLTLFEEPEAESSDEGSETVLAPAPPASLPALPLRLFAFVETAPEQAPPEPEPGIAPVSKEAPMVEGAGESAPPPAAAQPVAFELEVQAAPSPVAGKPETQEANGVPPSIALPPREEEAGTPTGSVVRRNEPAEAKPEVKTVASRDFEAPEAPETGSEDIVPSTPKAPATSPSVQSEIPAAPRPPQRSPEIMKTPELTLPPEPPRPAEAPRVALRLEPREGTAAPPVDVVVAQRGASLHFSVHSADGRLGAEMRGSLGELTERLEMLGYRAAAVIPAERAYEARQPAAPESSWSEGRNPPGSGFTGEEKRQGRRDRNQWRLEMQKQSESAA